MTKKYGGTTPTRILDNAVRPEDVKPIEAEIYGNDEDGVGKAGMTAAESSSSSSRAAAAVPEGEIV